MRLQARRFETALLLGLLVGLLSTAPTPVRGDDVPGLAGWDPLATVDSSQDGTNPLEPRYAPREPVEKPWYNTEYLFGITRSVTSSTLQPAAQLPLLVLTVPLDLALLPFAAIGGLFG